MMRSCGRTNATPGVSRSSGCSGAGKVSGADDGAAAIDPAAQAVGVAEELVDEGGRRLVIDLARRADLLDPAVVHDGDAVGELQRLFLVVGDEDRGQLHVVVQPAQPAAQFLAHLGVERAERLVEQQHARLDRERARQRHALALAAGELAGIAVAQALELHQAQQLVDLRVDLAPWPGACRAAARAGRR